MMDDQTDVVKSGTIDLFGEPTEPDRPSPAAPEPTPWMPATSADLFWIPVFEHMLKDPRLNHTDVLVFGYLHSFRMGDSRKIVRPGQKRIAESVKSSVSAVQRSVRKLRELGYVKVHARLRTPTGKRTNVYKTYPMADFTQDRVAVTGDAYLTSLVTPTPVAQVVGNNGTCDGKSGGTRPGDVDGYTPGSLSERKTADGLPLPRTPHGAHVTTAEVVDLWRESWSDYSDLTYNLTGADRGELANFARAVGTAEDCRRFFAEIVPWMREDSWWGAGRISLRGAMGLLNGHNMAKRKVRKDQESLVPRFDGDAYRRQMEEIAKGGGGGTT